MQISRSRYAINSQGCWLWLGRVDQGGYGRLGAELAHRVSYEKAIGPIPEGLAIDHLCLVRLCINPDHLEAVTQAENNRRAGSHIKQCPSGHAYDEINTYVDNNGHRRCNTCRAKWAAQANAKRAANRKARGLKRVTGHRLSQLQDGSWGCTCGTTFGPTRAIATPMMKSHREAL